MLKREQISKNLTSQEKEVVAKLFSFRQEHVFEYWNTLHKPEKTQLLQDLSRIDFSFFKLIKTKKKQKHHFSPINVISPPKTHQEKIDAQKAYLTGEDLLKKGKVALFMVAGGQGTRLGYPGPKGCISVTPVQQKSLFQVFAEKIKALEQKYSISIPWYIMTSPQNHIATELFFKKHHFFGLQNVHFLQQGIFPSLSSEGKLLLKDKNHLLLNPDGHGGALALMQRILPELHQQKKEFIFYFQVDDVLTNIADPLFLGYHALANADMSTKAVEKTDPEEKVGILGMIDKKQGVIEYFDLAEQQKKMKDKNGKLKYRAGNIAVHLFSIPFLQKIKKASLPFHLAKKKETIFKKNTFVQEEVFKYERFIFDTLPYAKKTITLMVDREKEFAPLKNKEGEKSLITVQEAQNHLFATWLEAKGISIPRDAQGKVLCSLEISPLYALTQEDFIKRFIQKSLALKKGDAWYVSEKEK